MAIANVYGWPNRNCQYKQAVVLEHNRIIRCPGKFTANLKDLDVTFMLRVHEGKLWMTLPYPSLQSKETIDIELTPESNTAFFNIEHQCKITFNPDYTELMLDGITAKRSKHAVRKFLSSNYSFFKKLEDTYLTEHRHDDPSGKLQHEYDKRFGLVKSNN